MQNQKISINKLLLVFFIILCPLFAVKSVCEEAKLPEEYQKKVLTYDFNNAEIIHDGIYGTIVLSKDRWKNWVARGITILSAYVIVLIIILSMPKKNEFELAICYWLSGVMFALSLWESLSGWLLFNINKPDYGYIFAFVSLFMYLFSYMILMKVKKSDVVNIGKKEVNIEKEIENPILSSVDNAPSKFEKEDFIK